MSILILKDKHGSGLKKTEVICSGFKFFFYLQVYIFRSDQKIYCLILE